MTDLSTISTMTPVLRNGHVMCIGQETTLLLNIFVVCNNPHQMHYYFVVFDESRG